MHKDTFSRRRCTFQHELKPVAPLVKPVFASLTEAEVCTVQALIHDWMVYVGDNEDSADASVEYMYDEVDALSVRLGGGLD